MEWLTGIKDLGFPAMIAFALLWVLTQRIEGFRKDLQETRDALRELRTCIEQLRLEVARSDRTEKE